MLKQRVITASIMMLVFLALLFLSPWQVFLACISVFFAVGIWEWSDLSGLNGVVSRLLYVLLLSGLGCLFLFATSFGLDLEVLKYLLGVICLWWFAAFIWVRIFPVGEGLAKSRLVRAFLGVLVILPAWLSVTFLIQQQNGPLLVLLGLLTVAAVDVGAYFTGRKFGKRKLAPVVSPGKSWEGVWGGLVLAMLVSLAFVQIFGELNFVCLLFVILPAALISVVGDLLESMVKRVRGIKDSGSILPGHGGVMDRIDGLTSAIPVYTLAILLSNWTL